LQIFSLICFTIASAGLVLSHLRSSHFGTAEFVQIGCFVFVAAITCHQLYRRRTAVLAETARPVAPIKFPPLLWPLAVVLSPLLVLGVMAVWTLNSDRRSATQEAKARADEIASSVMSQAEDDLNVVQFENSGFRVTQGKNIVGLNHKQELVSPPPWVWPPQPAPLTKNFSNLKSNKLAQWNEAEKAFGSGDWKRAADLYLAFLNGRARLGSQWKAELESGIADSRFRPIALSRRAAAIEKAGDVPGAIAAYNDIFDGFTWGPEAVSESGVGLAPLAVLKILDLAKDNPEALPEDWRRNPRFIVSQMAQNGPVSPISEEAIQRFRRIAPALIISSEPPVTTNALFELWDSAAEGRRFYAEAIAQTGTNTWLNVFWVTGTEPCLVVKQTPPADWPHGQKDFDETFYAFVQYNWLFQQLSNRFREVDRRGDFVISIDIAGRAFLLSGGWSPSNFNRMFDLAARRESPEMQQLHSASLPISLTIRLQDPETYYRAVHGRQFLFSALVIGALVAGLVAAWILRRSLLRQQSLNEQKSNFVSSVSHELRAPIASVRLMAESLERGKVVEGAKQNEYYRFIVQECRRLSSLIENVLDFSRIEQGRKQYEFEPTDVLALTRETVKLMEPYADEKGVQLKLETSNAEHRTPNVEVEIDGRAMQQALVNLIDNAIKHSAKGQTVTVGLDAGGAIQNTSAGTGKMPVLLWVEDHGPGIPAAEQEKIFERFYRLGSELRRETQGVGIGLSIVRHIVAAHGGQVTVRSSMGKGSRFTIVLPLNTKATDEHR
jgi:signal transduction histidine kinase